MKDDESLNEVLATYFHSVHSGDVVALRSIFHAEAELFGEVNGRRYRKSLDDYLEGVASRRSPASMGEPMLMRTLSQDVAGPIAMAKLNCPMLGFNYTVFLTLVRMDGRWLIVNKALTHQEPSPA